MNENEFDSKCPFCGSLQIQSTDEGENRYAPYQPGDWVIDRYECLNCGASFEEHFQITDSQ